MMSTSSTERNQSGLSRERLLELLSYDTITGLFTWKKPTSNRVREGDLAGVLSNGYWVIRIDGILWRAHRLAWLYVYGQWPKNEIDHKDLNRINNAICNLRDADRTQNQCNVGLPKSNTSGYKGITLLEGKYWRARIKYKKKEYHLGLFNSPEDAHEAYIKAAKELHGEFGRVA